MSQVRLLLTDAAWQELAVILETVQPQAGNPPRQSDRRLIEAGLYLARTGIPGRALPTECGQWDAVSNRFRRWEKRHVWQQCWQPLPSDALPVAKQLFLESTIVRAHQHTAGALQPTAGKQPRLGAVLAGALPPNSTRLETGDDRGVSRGLTGGERSAMPGCDEGLAQLPSTQVWRTP
jgi:transposase